MRIDELPREQGRLRFVESDLFPRPSTQGELIRSAADVGKRIAADAEKMERPLENANRDGAREAENARRGAQNVNEAKRGVDRSHPIREQKDTELMLEGIDRAEEWLSEIGNNAEDPKLDGPRPDYEGERRNLGDQRKGYDWEVDRARDRAERERREP